MQRSLLSAFLACGLGLGLAFACSATPTSNGNTGGSGNNSNVGGNGNPGAGTSSGATGNTGGLNIGDLDATTSPDACAKSTEQAKLTPVYMVIVFDTSGSMGDSNVEKNLNSRWIPVTQGMIDFFQNAPNAGGLSASITFFPAPGFADGTCTYDYSFPDVPMTELTDPQPLITALNYRVPSGGTPTLPALMGGLDYARGLLADNPGSRAMVVLVTDGQPFVCVDEPADGVCDNKPEDNYIDCRPPDVTDLQNTIPDIATVASAAARGDPAILTYVIGIGPYVSSLNTIATAGGTSLILLDATDATVTRTKLQQTLESIRVQQFSCDLQIPEVPVGETFSKDMVNVVFAHSGGTDETLPKNPTCAGAGVGWYYDNEASPSVIKLCDTSCTAIQADQTGTLQVELGCPSITL